MSSYAGRYNASITNRFTAGGPKKAGLSQHIGMGPFVYIAIKGLQVGRNGGTRGGRGSNVSGLNYPSVHKMQYPVSSVNQLGGVGMPRWGMFGPTADGVNHARIAQMRSRIAAGPPMWGL